MDEDEAQRCVNCEHFMQWDEYGNILGDCVNKEAFGFIGSLDGVQDPGECGCLYYVRYNN